MGWGAPPFYGKKKSKFYANKITRAKAKIEKQKAIIAECEKYIEHENACGKTEN